MATAEEVERTAAPVAAADELTAEQRIARVILASESITWLENKWAVSSARSTAYGAAAKRLDEALARIAAKIRRDAAAVERGIAELRRGENAARANRLLDASGENAERASRLVDAIARNLDAPTNEGNATMRAPVF